MCGTNYFKIFTNRVAKMFLDLLKDGIYAPSNFKSKANLKSFDKYTRNFFLQ